MKRVPGVNRVPTATWMRPLGSTSSVGFTQTYAPSYSLTKSLLRSFMAIPHNGRVYLRREVGAAAPDFKGLRPLP